MTAECACSCGNCTDLPVTPFQALRVSYGMLLGEDDFRVLMGNPRGKQMLHSSWLHGSGVVWGYRVGTEAAEVGRLLLRVSPGLGVDGLGREVELQASACLNLQDWLQGAATTRRTRTAAAAAPCTPAWWPSSTAA